MSLTGTLLALLATAVGSSLASGGTEKGSPSSDRARQGYMDFLGEHRYGIKKVGKFYETSDGRLHETYLAAQNHEATLKEKSKLEGDIGRKQSQFEGHIKAGAAELSELAQKTSARRQDVFLQTLKGQLAAQGADTERTGSLVSGVGEAQSRTLMDTLQRVEARKQQQLAGAKQFDIGTSLNVDQLGLRRDALAQQMNQFLMNQGLRRDEIQAFYDSQPNWWEELIGEIGGGVGQYYGTKKATNWLT